MMILLKLTKKLKSQNCNQQAALCFVQNHQFCSEVESSNVSILLREQLFQKVLEQNPEKVSLPEDCYQYLKNPSSYEFKENSGIEVIYSPYFKGGHLGSSLFRLLATLKALTHHNVYDAQTYHTYREQFLSKNCTWFSQKKQQTSKDIQHKLITFIYVNCGYNLDTLYGIRWQEIFRLKDFCQGELQKLKAEKLRDGHVLFDRCVSNFPPSFQQLVDQLVQNGEKLQRLSWLGDAVLHTFVSQQSLINDKIDSENFGKCNSNQVLAKVATEMRIHKYVDTKLLSGEYFLASLMEALIGYYFLTHQDIHLSCEWLLQSKEWIKTAGQQQQQTKNIENQMINSGDNNENYFQQQYVQKLQSFSSNKQKRTNQSVKEVQESAKNDDAQKGTQQNRTNPVQSAKFDQSLFEKSAEVHVVQTTNTDDKKQQTLAKPTNKKMSYLEIITKDLCPHVPEKIQERINIQIGNAESDQTQTNVPDKNSKQEINIEIFVNDFDYVQEKQEIEITGCSAKNLEQIDTQNGNFNQSQTEQEITTQKFINDFNYVQSQNYEEFQITDFSTKKLEQIETKIGNFNQTQTDQEMTTQSFITDFDYAQEKQEIEITGRSTKNLEQIETKIGNFNQSLTDQEITTQIFLNDFDYAQEKQEIEITENLEQIDTKIGNFNQCQTEQEIITQKFINDFNYVQPKEEFEITGIPPKFSEQIDQIDPKISNVSQIQTKQKISVQQKNSQQELKSIKNVRTEEKHERTDFSTEKLEQTLQNPSFQHQHSILPIDVVQKLYPDCRTQVLYYVLQLQADNTILAFSKNLLLTTKNSVTTKINKNDILQDSQKFGQNVTNEKIRNDLVTQILEKFSKLENEKKSRFLDQLLRKFLSANIVVAVRKQMQSIEKPVFVENLFQKVLSEQKQKVEVENDINYMYTIQEFVVDF